MKELTEKHLEEIINKQFDISGHKIRYEDVKGDKGEDMNGMGPWYIIYKATEEEGDIFRKWLIEYIKKECKVNKKIAEKEAGMIYLNWGLKVSQEEDKTY